MGVALLYEGITEEEEKEEFDERLRHIEADMLSGSSRRHSKDTDNELAENLLENHGENSHRHNHESAGSKCLRYFSHNETLKVIITIICAEMADRSQISAIALATNYNFWHVAIGGSFGHIIAIILAILFGKAVSEHTTEKCTNIVGGCLFLLFSAYSVITYFVFPMED